MIEISEVTKIFKNKEGDLHAVNQVSLSIGDGQIYGIVGYSGAGKSTLVRCINFLEKPDSGSISVSGFGTIRHQDGKGYYRPEGEGAGETALTEKHLKALRRDIGMIFQHFNLLASRTVEENVAFPLEIQGLPKDQIRARVAELLKLVQLDTRKDYYPSQLSGGQKQRVGIARALASNPKVLLSDEATSALDPQTTQSILALLKDINRKLNLTIVLITHQMEVVKEICDRVAVIENGNILEEGSMYRVFTNPQQDTTKEFVRTVNDIKLPPLFRKDRVKQSYFPGAKLIVNLEFLSDPDAPETKDGTADAYQPVVSTIIKKFGVDVNIL